MKTNKMIGNTYDLDMDKVTFNQLFNTTKKNNDKSSNKKQQQQSKYDMHL